MITPDNLYLLDWKELEIELLRMAFPPEGLFPSRRVPFDLPTKIVNGICWVLPNGNGFSTSSHVTKNMLKPGREVYVLQKGTPLPDKIGISLDRTPGKEGHYMIYPTEEMPVAEFIGKLQRIAENPLYCRKLSSTELAHAPSRLT